MSDMETVAYSGNILKCTSEYLSWLVPCPQISLPLHFSSTMTLLFDISSPTILQKKLYVNIASLFPFLFFPSYCSFTVKLIPDKVFFSHQCVSHLEVTNDLQITKFDSCFIVVLESAEFDRVNYTFLKRVLSFHQWKFTLFVPYWIFIVFYLIISMLLPFLCLKHYFLSSQYLAKSL